MTLLRKLQMVQNAAARVLTGTPWRAHITPILSQLHWLPVSYRITFKVLVLTFKAIRGPGPAYLRERLTVHAPGRALHSTNTNKLRIPGPKEVRLASTRARVFSALAPAWWNELPEDIRARTEIAKFRRACKTELFRQVYG